jgi:hypothetical protein
MIVRNDVTAETYEPIPFSTADLRRLKKDFRFHAPDVELDLGYTDDGKPYVSVTVPGAFDEAGPIIIIIIIIRSEVTGLDGNSKLGWQMHRGGDGPLYEFAEKLGKIAKAKSAPPKAGKIRE